MILTINELLKPKIQVIMPGFPNMVHPKDAERIAIEFAKSHVQEALKEASKNAKVSIKNINIGHDFEFTDTINEVNKDSILNVYPLTNIK